MGLILGGLVVLAFAVLARPTVIPGFIPGPSPDAPDYVYMAAALLHGSHLVDYDGPLHATRYTPGFPALLAPAVAIGGLDAAVWVPYSTALLLGLVAVVLTARLGGGLAAIIAPLLILFTPSVVIGAQIIMGDLPSAAFALLEVALLALGARRWSAAAGGLIAGALVWMRPIAVVLILAGSIALAANRARQRLGWYVASAGLVVLALAAWQWSAFGSPLITSYQAAQASPGGSAEVLNGFYALKYVFGPPWNAYAVGPRPNGVAYPLALLGLDSVTVMPGVGLLGIASALMLARTAGPAGVVGRFALAANTLTLLVFVPYFFRDERFLLIPAALNGVAAAVLIARALRTLRSVLPEARRAPTRPAL